MIEEVINPQPSYLITKEGTREVWMAKWQYFSMGKRVWLVPTLFNNDSMSESAIVHAFHLN